MSEENINEVVKFLIKNPVQYLATVGSDGKPNVRPFQFMLENEGKLYFCTNNQKTIYNQIKELPYIEITTSSPSFAWIRISGRVVFSDDMKIKNDIIESSDLVKSAYQTADNPIFEIFYLEETKAIIADFSGEPPVEYSL